MRFRSCCCSRFRCSSPRPCSSGSTAAGVADCSSARGFPRWLVIVRVLQLRMQWPLPLWLEFGLPAALAYANLVLAFVLAGQTLSFRYERDVAHRLAERDPLTGVLNRRAILARLRSEFAKARQTGEPLSLLFLDLDHFKNVNDSYGHRAGRSVPAQRHRSDRGRAAPGRCARPLRRRGIPDPPAGRGRVRRGSRGRTHPPPRAGNADADLGHAHRAHGEPRRCRGRWRSHACRRSHRARATRRCIGRSRPDAIR